MAACGQLVHALRDSGQETPQRSVPSPVGTMGDMAMSPWLRTSNMTKKFRSKRLTTTAIAISTTSAVGSIQPIPSGEPSPISTPIKVFLTSRKGVGKNSDYLKGVRLPTPAQLIRLSLELKKRKKIPINHCVLQLFLSNIKGWTVFAQPLSTIKKDEKPLGFFMSLFNEVKQCQEAFSFK